MKELGKHLLGGATIVVAIVVLLKLLYAAPQLDELSPVEAGDVPVLQTSKKTVLGRLPASVQGTAEIEVKKKLIPSARNGAIHFLVEILAQSSRSQPLFYDRLISFHSFS